MNLVPLNKSAIVEYGMFELIRKLWNLSKNMRKRVQRLLKGRVIVLIEYDCRVTVFGCWIRTLQGNHTILKRRKPLEGLCDYIVKSEKDVKTIQKLNGALACNLRWLSPKSPLTFEVVPKLDISNLMSSDNLKFTFIRVIKLVANRTKATEIQQILSRITYLDSLKIKNSSLSNLDLSSNHIKHLILDSVTIEGNVKLPSVLDSIRVKNCEGINLLKFNKIRRFYCEDWTSSDEKEYYHLFTVRKPENDNSQAKHVAINLPPSVRYVEGSIITGENLFEIKARLPYLIEVEKTVYFPIAQFLNLRVTSTSGLDSDQVNLRPRKVIVTTEGPFNPLKYKKLFKKTTQFIFLTNKFDFNLIPDGEKHVKIYFGDILINPDDSFDSVYPPNTEFETSLFTDGLNNLEDNLWKFDDQSLEIVCQPEEALACRIDSETITFSDCSFQNLRSLKIICDGNYFCFKYGKQTNVEDYTSSDY